MKNKTKFLLTIIFVLGILILLGSTNVYAGIIIPGDCDIWWIHRTSLR